MDTPHPDRQHLLAQIATLEQEIAERSVALAAAKTALREVENATEQDAPYECELCHKGIWDPKKRHKHTMEYFGVIPRPAKPAEK